MGRTAPGNTRLRADHVILRLGEVDDDHRGEQGEHGGKKVSPLVEWIEEPGGGARDAIEPPKVKSTTFTPVNVTTWAALPSAGCS